MHKFDDLGDRPGTCVLCTFGGIIRGVLPKERRTCMGSNGTTYCTISNDSTVTGHKTVGGDHTCEPEGCHGKRCKQCI